MKSDFIVDNRLHVKFDIAGSLKQNWLFQINADAAGRFTDESNNIGHLANQLLLYEKIVIPTKDFGIVPIFVNWFGLKIFLKALNSDAFHFLHLNSLLGYAGNGNGIIGFAMSQGESLNWAWWQDAMWREMDIAIEQQLRNMCPSISRKERASIISKIISKSRNFEYENEFFMKNIVQESYTDIINSKALSNFIKENSKLTKGNIDLTRLEGIDPNQMKVSHTEGIKEPLDLVLRVAEINMEIVMGNLSSADLLTSPGAELLLKDKLKRAGIESKYLDGFLRLLELNKIPDINKAISSGSLSLLDIFKLREKRMSRKFRRWLREADPKDARDLEKIYVESLANKTLVNSLPLKIFRFTITSVAGALHPAAGLGTGIVDSFFVDKWLSGYSPKLFLDELRKLPMQE